MVKCEICGKEFKTTQGLRGHKTFAHGIGKTGEVMAGGVFTFRDKVKELEERVNKLENLGVTVIQRGINELKREVNAERGSLWDVFENMKREIEGLKERVSKLRNEKILGFFF